MENSFYAMLGRMKYIERWGLMRCAASENLSEHTMEVAYLAHALTVIGTQRFSRELDAGKAVLYALYHDCSEILTGDLPTPVKYGNETLRTAYKEVERQAERQILKKLPGEMAAEYEKWFAIEAPYRPIIKAADKISALIKCMEEQKLGNRDFDTAYQSTLESIHAMQLPEAEIFLKEFLPPYNLTLDEL